ncbi:MAG: UDP-N-acetylmuramoyl-L-alanyl-D-glutamate--2,6-diaminopimelate ligase [Patescibacteria group bacterium]|nr:UDP-N-acetylmuramoyl-L-alanyl-D-glutamate--2,6-diaminopimelate ligase [Patescibacteria group bacterium]MCL5093696.1 UDP-N-acetylmuramoyl-L-alanyl-D-glutamate--2,6-diaminopimelate ligase [Patescibacteria group bacterium]
MEKILALGRKIIPKKLFRLGQPFYHFCLAFIANVIYRFPGRKIKAIGITGTNGKSTTSNLAVAILEEAGYKVGLSSTTNFQIGAKKWDNEIDRTMAGRFATIKLLRQMVNAKCDYAVIEVPSHGIAQFRVWGVLFDAAVLTNITHDHLDYHKTFENYVKTKERLFKNAASSSHKKLRDRSGKKAKVKKFIILNHDDPQYGRFNKNRADLNISFSTKNKRASLLAKEIEIKEDGVNFKLISYRGNIDFNLKLTGLFNVYNALAATAVGLSQDIKPETIKKALEKVRRIPGRLEVVRGRGRTVVIDYAHTPDALENIYSTVREFTKGNLIAVFGATGDRDKAKRPVMGEIAGRMADIVYLTDEEPGSEEPETIIEEIAPGILKAGKKEDKNYYKILDREKAIIEAIKNAETGDTIVVSGIGHQKFRLIKGIQTPWDERGIIEKALA